MTNNPEPPPYISSDPWGDMDYGTLQAARREHEHAPLIPGQKSRRSSKIVYFLLAAIAVAAIAAVIAIPVHISSDRRAAASVDRRHRVELRRLNTTHGAELDDLTERYEHQIHWRQAQMDQMVAAHDRQLKEVRSAYEQRLRAKEMRMEEMASMHRRQLREVQDNYEERLQAKDKWVENQKRLLSARESAVRDEEERVGNDAERRKKANLYWDASPKRGAMCTEWKTISYSAELHNVPEDVDAVAWCQDTAIDIFGLEEVSKPDYCEQNNDHKVHGHWTLRNDPGCHTLWGRQKDEGCQAGSPGHRLIKMQLLDHHYPWNTWLQMCETTPWGDEGPTPEICENRGKDGIWGKWLVQDAECK